MNPTRQLAIQLVKRFTHVWILFMSWSVACPTFGGTLDRQYRFGDDPAEAGVAGDLAGSVIESFLLTFDSVGEPRTGNLQDLEVFGNPRYIDASSRPGAADDEVAIGFDGVNDFLTGNNLNYPAASRASVGYVDENSNPLPGPENYNGIVARSMQFWARRDGAGLSGMEFLVMDSNQHGVLIDDDARWTMRYAGRDIPTTTTVDSDWHHFMMASTGNAARLWIDGVAAAAASGGYDQTSRVELVVGANTGRDDRGEFNGGSDGFFSGIIDELELAVVGNNASNAGPPQGRDYGELDLLTDNAFIQSAVTNVPGDLNLDGVFDEMDRQRFIDGWGNRNEVNGVLIGDLNSFQAGDLDLSGVTDLRDLATFQAALRDSPLAPLAARELAPIPEPTTLLSTLIGVVMLLQLRGRFPRVSL